MHLLGRHTTVGHVHSEKRAQAFPCPATEVWDRGVLMAGFPSSQVSWLLTGCGHTCLWLQHLQTGLGGFGFHPASGTPVSGNRAHSLGPSKKPSASTVNSAQTWIWFVFNSLPSKVVSALPKKVLFWNFSLMISLSSEGREVDMLLSPRTTLQNTCRPQQCNYSVLSRRVKRPISLKQGSSHVISKITFNIKNNPMFNASNFGFCPKLWLRTS